MRRRRRHGRRIGRAIIPLLAVWLAVGRPEVSAQTDNGYTNLRVLPADISREELGQIMLDNLSGLGLPRRSGEGCLHCHVGSVDVPRTEWDYAADDKPAKETARVMMAMVREINDAYLGALPSRSAPPVEVGCYTCHAGRTNPMPLEDLLLSTYEREGPAALAAAYRAARARYYEGDAYDFRESSLIAVADRIAAGGDYEAAAAVHELNVEYAGTPTAYGGLVRLRLLEALDGADAEAMLARYRALKESLPARAFHPLTVDPLGWALFRSGRTGPALALFELNFAEHPDAFAAHESLAYALFDQGERERGLELARRWREAHPDHEGGRQLLMELEMRR